ncbi:MAG: sugar ABC transporter ATP-binding protein [Bryobacterales bacterium]|nr:sugar ABC transporter ATP-binding protein [Bryobacteraceae bacterium]MDW8353322.1 sugar ABC transporter ATP-binding protein [Bryobacterales bacterium]
MLLELEGIQKRFGGVVALRRGDLRAEAGEVHLLLGENGAGKSTLMKIVAGMVQPDGGVIRWRGQPVSFRAPAEAAAHGIAMVHQESLLAPHLTVAENIFLGREDRLPFGWVNRRRMMERAARLIEEHHFPLQADWRVERLSPAGKQLVEICRAIYHGSSLLIFDEPTSSLSEAETQEVFRIVRTLRERHMGVIYITHRLEELRAVGDRVTILRDGETVHSGPLAGLSTEEIIRHMVGRELEAIYHRECLPPGEELLRVEGLSRRGVLHDIRFTLRAREIVGLAGLVGAGRTELCRALFGLDPVDGGRVFVAGKEVHIRNPRQAVAAGLALIPEDRQRNGLAVLLPIGHNLTHARLKAVSPHGIIDHAAERRTATEFIERLRIRAESWRQLAGKLSGGNQQKVVVGKWLFSQARVFLFDEPTRGIDVAAKAEVFHIMDELARSGAAILMVSSELPELLQVADRILVMRQGRLVVELPRGATQEEVMRHAMLEREAGVRELGS